jgi:hypothetical protein
MANIMRCCECSTTWINEETDLRYEVFRVDFSSPSGYPSQYRGAVYEWRYQGPPPGDGRVVTEYSQAKVKNTTPPSSSCDCVNSCGGNQGNYSFLGETVESGGQYTYTYFGYWRKISGPASAPSIVYGRHDCKYARQFYKIKFSQEWSNKHLCGNICPGCDGIKEFDKINQIFNIWQTMTPPG